MSLASMVRRQGSLVAIYRPTFARNSDGTAFVTSWAAIASDVEVNLQGLGYETAQKVFGTQEVVEADGFALSGADLQRDDRLLVTRGPFLNLKFRVVDLKRHRQGSASDHLEVALQSTTETFP